MEGAMWTQMALDDPATGALSWQCLLALVKAVRNAGTLSEEVKAYLKGRLKSEYAVVVLNTFTVLHTLVLNSNHTVRSQLAGSKILKAAERVLNKPLAPGLELAVAQLFFDWSYTHGREELGSKCYQMLNAGKNRVLLSVMAPSDVVVMIGEDRKIGMPRLGLTKGLDFARMHGDPSLAVPGSSSVSSVMTALARQALAPLGGGAAGSTHAYPQHLDEQDEPRLDAEKLLLSIVRMQGDMATLAAVERACREVVKMPGASVQLSRHLDDGYVAACRCASWRSKIQALASSGIDGDRMERLLGQADALNAALQAWQAFASDDLFRLLGVDVAARTAALTADPQQQPQQQQQRQAGIAAGGTGTTAARPDYMDILTGDSNSSGHTINPLIAATAAATGAGTAVCHTQQQQQHAGSSAALDLLTGDDPAYAPFSPSIHYPVIGSVQPTSGDGPCNPFVQSAGNASNLSVASTSSLHAAGSGSSTAAASAGNQPPLGRTSLPLQQHGSTTSLQQRGSTASLPQLSSSSNVQQAPASPLSMARASVTPLQSAGSGESSSSGGGDTGSSSYINPFVNVDKIVLAAAGIVPPSSQGQPVRAITGEAGPSAAPAALPQRSATGGDSSSRHGAINPFRTPAAAALMQQQRQQRANGSTGPGGSAGSSSCSRAAPAAAAAAGPGSPSTIQTTPFDPFAEDGAARTPSRLGQSAAASTSGSAAPPPKRQPPPPPSAAAITSSRGGAYPPVPSPNTPAAPAATANGYVHNVATSAPMQHPYSGASSAPALAHAPQSIPMQQPQPSPPPQQPAAAGSRAPAPSGPAAPPGLRPPASPEKETKADTPFLPQLHAALRHAQEVAGPTSLPGGCCFVCALPPRQALLTAFGALLSDVQRQHQQELRALRAAHEREVAGIKATAVARIKELMAAMQSQATGAANAGR